MRTMRRKAVKILIAFGVVNIVGILVFYGWIVSRPLTQHKHSSVPSIVFRSDSEIRIKDKSAGNMRNVNNVLISNTLKSPRTQQKVDKSIPPVPEHPKSDLFIGHALKLAKAEQKVNENIPHVPEYSKLDLLTGHGMQSSKGHQKVDKNIPRVPEYSRLDLLVDRAMESSKAQQKIYKNIPSVPEHSRSNLLVGRAMESPNTQQKVDKNIPSVPERSRSNLLVGRAMESPNTQQKVDKNIPSVPEHSRSNLLVGRAMESPNTQQKVDKNIPSVPERSRSNLLVGRAMESHNTQQKVDKNIPSIPEHSRSNLLVGRAMESHNTQQKADKNIHSAREDSRTNLLNDHAFRSSKAQQQNDKNIHPGYSRSDLLTGHTLKPSRAQQKVNENIPPVPEYSRTDDVFPLDDAVMQKYLAYPEKKPTDSILILTPIHDVEDKLKTFMYLLQSITYPHQLISIAFGEDSSHDNTLHIADAIAIKLRKSFARVDVFHFNLTGQVNGSWSNIHSRDNQLYRRRHLAQSRNSLLRSGLKSQDWVLWIDSDINYLPPDIVQQLLSAEKDIVAPVCVFMDNRNKRVFDKNTWRETRASLAYQNGLPSDELMLEGYDTTRRLWLSDLRAEGRVVPIDGVGGCTLLIRSECHKNGVIFPETIFQHHIETEGLAKLAKHMGYGVYGMPFVEVIH